MAATSPRTDLAPAPSFASLTRPILVGGLEREAGVPLVTIVLVLLIQFTVLTWGLAGLLVFALLPELRRRAKADPQAFAVLKAHLALAGYYQALPAPDVPRRSGPKTF
jgi:type IV secretory pathway TrbD component